MCAVSPRVLFLQACKRVISASSRTLGASAAASVFLSVILAREATLNSGDAAKRDVPGECRFHIPSRVAILIILMAMVLF